jgi:pyridoxamine 5'-phosphate oxidase
LLFSKTATPSDIWQSIKHELHRGALDPKHPFRYVNLGTIGENYPQVRTVVLREVTQELDFLVYSDFRSEKVKEIQACPKVALHFYHPKKMLQLRVEAKVVIHFQDELSEYYWKKIPESRQSEYMGITPPGNQILSPDSGWDLGENFFFSVLKINPVRIEALQLSKDGHLRIQFEKANDWKEQWLAP